MSNTDNHTTEYRNEVQTRVQDLLTGRRSRDPRLSSFSTRRLVLEAIVEELRIYRLRREGEVRAQWEREMGGRRRHEERSGERNCRDGEHKHRHGHERGRESDEKRQRRERGERHGIINREVRDPVVEGPRGTGREYMMSGAAGTVLVNHTPRESPGSTSGHPPTITPSTSATDEVAPISTSLEAQIPTHHPRHSRDFPHPTREPSSHPPRRLGPDGVTPFGYVPSRAAGVGLAAHFMSTYKHIKAEHDAGHRARGVLERTVDGWRGKEKSTKLVQKVNQRVEEYGRHRGVPDRAGRRVGDGRGKMGARREVELPIRPRGSGSTAVHSKAANADDQASMMHVQAAPPITPYNDEESPRPSAPGPAQGSLHHARQSTFQPLLSNAIPIPPPPPLPSIPKFPIPPSRAPTQPPSPDHSSLLTKIRTAPKLRKVPASQVRDKSAAVSAGNVYEATEHSREVEARERGEVDDYGDGEEEADRRRRLRRELGGE